MKVALFFTYGYSLKTWSNSGTLERELKIYEELSKKHSVIFKFFTYGDESEYEYKTKNIEIIPIYSIIKYNKNSILRFIKSFFIPFVIKKHIKDVSIIQQHQILGSWIPLLTKLLINKPVYIRTGYDMYEFSIKENKKRIIIFLYKFLTRVTLKYANIYTVASKSDQSFLNKNFKVRNNDLVYRPNWVEIKELNKEKRINNKILTVGRLAEQKNYSYLISEFKNTKDYLSIDIVGSGPLENALLASAKENNVNINLLGNVEHDQLMELYREYKIYISTSSFEGNPKTILEAMSSGCIVIASNIPNHRELITDKVTGALFDIETGSLINTFKNIEEDYLLCEKIPSEAHYYMSKNFSIDSIVNKTYEDYKILNLER